MPGFSGQLSAFRNQPCRFTSTICSQSDSKTGCPEISSKERSSNRAVVIPENFLANPVIYLQYSVNNSPFFLHVNLNFEFKFTWIE